MKAIKRLFGGTTTTPEDANVAPEVEKKAAPIPDDQAAMAKNQRDTQRRLAGRGRTGTVLSGSNQLG